MTSTFPAVNLAALARPGLRLRGILAMTVAVLAAVTGIVYLLAGQAPALPRLDWLSPVIMVVQAMTSLVVSMIAIGRYRVLGDPASLRIGIGFGINTVSWMAYVLVWPGLLPGGGSLAGASPGTPAWFTVIGAGALGAFFLAAALTRAPIRPAGQRHWRRAFAAWLGGMVGVSILLVAGEAYLPALVRADGSFTLLLGALNGGVILLFGIGATVAARRAERGRDSLLAMVAFMQVALVFVYLWVSIGAERYDLWWYVARALMTLTALAVLVLLLAGHVDLLRREREKSRALSAAEARLEEHLAGLQEAHARLQQAEQRKDEFLAMLSHELRNPLATISNFLHVLQTNGVTEQQRERVHEAALRQSAHMARLLDDLLDVSRITRGQITLRRELTDVAALVRDAIDALATQAEARGQRVGMAIVPGLWVRADPVRITQAISNLVHNAIKYTPEGGTIRIIAERDADAAVIRVRDDGRGIPAAELDGVFELFVQAEQPLDRSAAGLGIGLTITRALIEMHGGSVAAHSDGPGAGSEFVLRLPLVQAPSGREPVTAARADRFHARRILLVEDNPDSAETLATLLSLEGHEVRVAGSGESALETAATFAADLVLLDLGLPGIDGYEAARRLRRLEGLRSAVFVALTGYGRDEDRARTRAAGFDHHLVKPVEITQLGAVLATLGCHGAGA